MALTEEEYINAQNTLTMVARAIHTIPLEEMLNMIEHAESAGPFIDPTLYRQAGDKLDKLKRLVRAARSFKEETDRQIKEAEEKRKANL